MAGRTNRNKLYEELGWESLTDRRWYRRLIQLYNIRTNMTPIYLRNNLPRQRTPLHRTNSDCYHEIYCNTLRYTNSFFPNAIKSWNDIGRCTSLDSFKQSIINFIRPIPKSTFGIPNPLGVKCLYQLKVELSPPKCHTKRHNFIDTPSDCCESCCVPESTCNYLMAKAYFICF